MRSELAHIFVALLHRRDWTVRLPVSSSYSDGKFSNIIFALEDGSCKRRNRTFTEDLGNEKRTLLTSLSRCSTVETGRYGCLFRHLTVMSIVKEQ